ncbi:MAG TPA: ABC transporter ATP-binding protein, partial [Geobacteraceae bacterium]
LFAGLLLLVSATRLVLWWFGRMMVHRKGRVLTYQLRRDLFLKWGTLSPAYYHGHSIGDLLSHALSDVEVVRELVSMGINVSASGLSLLAAVFYMMAVHGDWRLSLAGLGPMLAIPLMVRYLGPKLRIHSQRCQEALGSMAQIVEEVFGGIRAVKAFGNERVVIGRFEAKVETIVTERVAFVRLSALFEALVPLLANLGFIIVLGYGGYLTVNGAITLGDFVASTMYVAMLRNPLEHLGKVLNLVQRAAASLGRIAALLAVVPAVRDREGDLVDRPIRGALRVERLTFRYPGTEREVLSDISFAVGPGKTLGIVGPMGSGKTTLADLLLRLYDPPEGTVFVDGEDILRYPLARVREGVAYVPQDGFLFSTTLLENISFSDVYPDRERASRATRVTALAETIEQFPDGFATEIGERGVRISGGQKQRVAIARMVYKDAPIRILDDSLSAVDTSTERQVLKNLGDDGRKDATTIVISHRLSAVQHADEILVLDDGRIVERGNHAGLVAANGHYAALWFMQSGISAEELKSREAGRADDVEAVVAGLTKEVEAVDATMKEEEAA